MFGKVNSTQSSQNQYVWSLGRRQQTTRRHTNAWTLWWTVVAGFTVSDHGKLKPEFASEMWVGVFNLRKSINNNTTRQKMRKTTTEIPYFSILPFSKKTVFPLSSWFSQIICLSKEFAPWSPVTNLRNPKNEDISIQSSNGFSIRNYVRNYSPLRSET